MRTISDSSALDGDHWKIGDGATYTISQHSDTVLRAI